MGLGGFRRVQGLGGLAGLGGLGFRGWFRACGGGGDYIKAWGSVRVSHVRDRQRKWHGHIVVTDRHCAITSQSQSYSKP